MNLTALSFKIQYSKPVARKYEKLHQKTRRHEAKAFVKSDRKYNGVFMLFDAKRYFFYEKVGMIFRTCLARLTHFCPRKVSCSANSYTIVSPVSMVRVGGHQHSQRVHILVYGKIDPPDPGVTVQVTFQGHQLDIDSVDSSQTRSVTTLTDRSGEFVVDENFICGAQVKFITSVSSLPEREAPTVIASLRLEETRGCCKKCGVRENKKPLPAATITIDFESHCQHSVTYWFENPYKKGSISRTTEISYCPTESSALYLKLYPHQKSHTKL